MSVRSLVSLLLLTLDCISSFFFFLLLFLSRFAFPFCGLILIHRMPVCQFAMFSLAESFGPVFSFPASSKSNSFRHFLSPERPSNGLRLQRHLPPGFAGPPYDRSGCLCITPHLRSASQCHTRGSNFTMGSVEWPVACVCVRSVATFRRRSRPPSSLAALVSTWACLRSATS